MLNNEKVIVEREFLDKPDVINSYLSSSLRSISKRGECVFISGELNFYVKNHCNGFLLNIYDLSSVDNPYGPHTIDDIIEEVVFDNFARLEVGLTCVDKFYSFKYDNYIYRSRDIDAELACQRAYARKIFDGSCRSSGLIKSVSEERAAIKEIESYIVELNKRRNNAFMTVTVSELESLELPVVNSVNKAMLNSPVNPVIKSAGKREN